MERSAWQRERDGKAARPGLGFMRKASDQDSGGEYSGNQVGFNRIGRWWRRASESEYSGSGRFGFKKEAA